MVEFSGQSGVLQKSWLIIGHPNNWQTAFNQPIPIWGFTDQYFSNYENMQRGDFLIFYATSPIKGVIGIGLLKDKYIDRQTLIWDDEKVRSQALWPLRLRFEVWHLLPVALWKSSSVSVSDLNMNFQTSIKNLQPAQFTAVLAKMKEKWGIESLGKEPLEYAGPTLITSLVMEEEAAHEFRFRPQDLHNKAQMTIAGIGKLQNYYTEVEYSLKLTGEIRRLDVVWKREITGVPTYAFEVEMSGQIERAVAKLRQAYSLWNSRPLLIVPKKEHAKVKNLVEKEQPAFRETFCFYDFSVMEELYAKKKDLREFENRYRIY